MKNLLRIDGRRAFKRWLVAKKVTDWPEWVYVSLSLLGAILGIILCAVIIY